MLVVSHPLIQGREAVRSIDPPGCRQVNSSPKIPPARIKLPSGPSAPQLAWQLALGLRSPFRFGAVPERPGYSPSWIAPSSERVAAPVQAPPLRWPAPGSALPEHVRGRMSVNVCLSQRSIFGHYGKVVPNAFQSFLIERPGLSLRANVTSAVGGPNVEPESQDRN